MLKLTTIWMTQVLEEDYFVIFKNLNIFHSFKILYFFKFSK